MMPSLDMPCPHPVRKGRHEIYHTPWGLVCRACGAAEPRDGACASCGSYANAGLVPGGKCHQCDSPFVAEPKPIAMAYVATGLARVDDQRAVVEALAVEGVGLSFDWTRNGSLAGRDLSEVALDEIEGVKAADVLVVLLPGGRGTHAELGAALATGKAVFVHAATDAVLLGQDGIPCVFYSHPLVKTCVGDVSGLLATVRLWLQDR